MARHCTRRQPRADPNRTARSTPAARRRDRLRRRAAAAPAPANASTIVDSVQKFYAGIKQVTAQFRQSVTNNTFGSTKTSDGTVWLMKPGKMRWDYVEKKKDNKSRSRRASSRTAQYLYVVEHDNKQVVKKNLAERPDAGRGHVPLRQGRPQGRVQRRDRHDRQVRREG